MPPITVVVADREKEKRTTCAGLLNREEGIQVVAQARNGLDAMATTSRLRPDILLLSLDLLRGSEIALLSVLDLWSPGTRVILLTRADHGPRILEALSYGARGCIGEETIDAFLPKAIRSVSAGEAWIPHRMIPLIIERLASVRIERAGPRTGYF